MRLGPLGIDLDKIDLASLDEVAIQSYSLHLNQSKRIIDLRVEDPDMPIIACGLRSSNK